MWCSAQVDAETGLPIRVPPRKTPKNRDMDRLDGHEALQAMKRAVVLAAPAGSLTLWRSDTPHANTGNDKGAYALFKKDNEAVRLAIMTCWNDSDLQPAGVAEQKQAAYLKGASGNHIPTVHSYGGSGRHMSCKKVEKGGAYAPHGYRPPGLSEQAKYAIGWRK